MKKVISIVVFLLFVGFFAFANGDQEMVDTSQGEVNIDSIEPIEIGVTSITPVGHPIYSGMVLFKELVEGNSKGKIKVNLFPGSQLGDQVTQFEMVRSGSVEIGHLGSIMSNVVKEYNIGGAMYLFRDYEHFLKVWGGAIGKEIGSKLENYGVHVLNSVGLVGVRHVLSKKPVRSVEDLKGLAIRVPESPMFTEGFKALGANPTTIAFAEVYTALQLGTVDAMECPLDWIYKMKFYDVAKNLTLTSHISGDPYSYVINKEFWEGLPPAAQKTIEEAALAASLHANMSIKLAEADFRNKMEAEGVKFIEVDLEPFQRKVEAAMPELASLWGGGMELYNRIKNTTYKVPETE